MTLCHALAVLTQVPPSAQDLYYAGAPAQRVLAKLLSGKFQREFRAEDIGGVSMQINPITGFFRVIFTETAQGVEQAFDIAIVVQ
jgi:hypothetical protein